MAIRLQDKRTQKLILIGILLGALLYVFFLTTLVPFTFKASAAEIKDLSDRYRDMAGEITKARQTLSSLPYLEKEYSLLHAKWQKAQALLPDEEENASLLRAVTLLGDQSGVEFVLFRPMDAQVAQFYTEHPIEVKVEGGYNEIGTFLGELANMERIVTVSNLEIASVNDAKNDKSATASFIAKTYTLGGTGVSPEQAQAQAKGKPEGSAVGKTVERAQQIGAKLKAKTRGEPSNE